MNLEMMGEDLTNIRKSLEGNLPKSEEKLEMRRSAKVDIFIEQATEYAKSWIGTPYKWGGEAIGDGVDCSGLVRRILHRCLPNFPKNDMTAQMIFNHLADRMDHKIHKGYDNIKPGHILFFGRDPFSITHVGYAHTAYHMIEAGGGGSRTRTKEDAYNQGAWVRISLVEKRSDLCAHIDPWEKM